MTSPHFPRLSWLYYFIDYLYVDTELNQLLFKYILTVRPTLENIRLMRGWLRHLDHSNVTQDHNLYNFLNLKYIYPTTKFRNSLEIAQ